MGKQVCRVCKEEKDESLFYKAKSSGYYNLDCNKCKSEKAKGYYLENREEIKKSRREAYYNNIEVSRKQNRESYHRNAEKRLAYYKNRIEEWNKKIHNYYSGECCICHYNEPCFSVYECHHLDPRTKKYMASRLSSKDWETEALPELEKCVYLCIICHRKLHKGRFDDDIKSGKLILIPGGKNKNEFKTTKP